jgi:hypothetical protein
MAKLIKYDMKAREAMLGVLKRLPMLWWSLWGPKAVTWLLISLGDRPQSPRTA